MELKILSDEQNKMMKRREITVSINDYMQTTTRSVLKEEVCKKLNLSPDNTIVNNIHQDFGTRSGKAIIHTYESSEILKKIEPKHLLKRIGLIEEKKEEEKPQDATAKKGAK